MKVLVTGGAGFIGSHTCLALLEKGFEVVAIDSYVNSNEKSLNRIIQFLKTQVTENINVNIHNIDIRDEERLDNLFLGYQRLGTPIEAVIHFAGLKSVKESIQNPLEYWDVNVNGAITLLKVMNRYYCRTFVFSSSATIYGMPERSPISEETNIDPINPYGQTKATVEKLLNDIYEGSSKEWKISNLRYFNPIGAHSSGIIGEDPLGLPNNIFPYITQVAVRNLDKLTIFGNDWPTSDGTGIRDYIHVMDLAEGHIAALEFLIKSKSQIINLNLGTGKGTSVIELVKTFERTNNIKIPSKFSNRREGDCCTLIADNSLATALLKWSPRRSLKEMCADGWKWQLLNPQGYN